jgi:hypothetical protein
MAVGVGIWYLSSSIGGGSITYASLDGFLTAIGACDGGTCDVAAANGCFLCGYIEKLFLTIGTAAEGFWNALVSNLWIVMAGGFAIFLFVHTFNVIQEQNKKNAELSTDERKIDFSKWFDAVWRQGARILVAGVFIGAIGWGGTAVLRAVSDIVITPVMYVGSELSMAATGVESSGQCGASVLGAARDNAIGPALAPFMCVVGNLNAVVLAGASGGFSLMNFAYMKLGGGALTWLAGLGLVIMFLYVGFRLFFQILTVVFQLVFIIVFLPLIIAAWAFEKTWGMAKGAAAKAVDILCNCAVRVIAISLKTLIIYAAVSFAADEFFPGPADNYTAILPPGIAMNNPAASAAAGAPSSGAAYSVVSVFSKCERAATNNGEKVLDNDAFKDCFMAEKTAAELRHPGAFDFMKDGFSFILLMLGLFFIYFYVVEEKVDEILGKGKDGEFEFGKYVKELGQSVWNVPKKIGAKITGAMKK